MHVLTLCTLLAGANALMPHHREYYGSSEISNSSSSSSSIPRSSAPASTKLIYSSALPLPTKPKSRSRFPDSIAGQVHKPTFITIPSSTSRAILSGTHNNTTMMPSHHSPPLISSYSTTSYPFPTSSSRTSTSKSTKSKTPCTKRLLDANLVDFNMSPTCTSYVSTTTSTAYIDCQGCKLETVLIGGLGPVKTCTATVTKGVKTEKVTRCETATLLIAAVEKSTVGIGYESMEGVVGPKVVSRTWGVVAGTGYSRVEGVASATAVVGAKATERDGGRGEGGNGRGQWYKAAVGVDQN